MRVCLEGRDNLPLKRHLNSPRAAKFRWERAAACFSLLREVCAVLTAPAPLCLRAPTMSFGCLGVGGGSRIPPLQVPRRTSLSGMNIVSTTQRCGCMIRYSLLVPLWLASVGCEPSATAGSSMLHCRLLFVFARMYIHSHRTFGNGLYSFLDISSLKRMIKCHVGVVIRAVYGEPPCTGCQHHHTWWEDVSQNAACLRETVSGVSSWQVRN